MWQLRDTRAVLAGIDDCLLKSNWSFGFEVCWPFVLASAWATGIGTFNRTRKREKWKVFMSLNEAI